MWRWTALLGATILSVLVGLGHPAIQDADEGFYAESGREMVQSGNWITPHFNEEPRLNKPILFYWLVALDYKIGGVSETGARLWSAIAAIGLAFVTAARARRWFGPEVALLSAGIVATSLGLTRLARSALPDIPLACFVTLSIWAAFEFAEPERPRGVRRWWLMTSAVGAALGFLTKGPVAWVLIALVIIPCAAWERIRADGRAYRWRLDAVDCGLVISVVALVAAPWFVLATLQNGVGFLRAFFIGENVDRFMTDRFNVRQPAWYYLPVIAGGLMPWSPFLLLLIRPVARIARTRRISIPAARLAIWALVPLAFFTVSTGKQPRYIVPCLVPIAILVAREAQARVTAGFNRGVALAGALAGLTLTAIALLADRLAPVLRAADPHWTAVGPVLIGSAGIVMLAASIRLRGAVRTLAWIGAAAVAAVAVEATVYWPTRPEPVERVAARLVEAAPQSPICSCGAFERNLDFYAHVRNVATTSEAEMRQFLASPSPVYAVVDDAVLRRVEGGLGRPIERLLAVPYLDPARLRVGDLLRRPDAGIVRSIVLVRTR